MQQSPGKYRYLTEFGSLVAKLTRSTNIFPVVYVSSLGLGLFNRVALLYNSKFLNERGCRKIVKFGLICVGSIF